MSESKDCIDLDLDDGFSSDWAEYVSKVERHIIQQLSSLKIGGQSIMPKAIIGCKNSLNDSNGVEATIYYENNIQIQKKNSKLSISAVKSFYSLNVTPQLLQGVFEIGLNKPSRLQEVVLPTLLANPPQNMMVQSQPGTGKMTAFVMGMLSRVDPMAEYPQVLCLVPTHEFAMQTGDVVARMVKYCPKIKMAYALNGEKVANRTEHIIIGTPNKAADWAYHLKIFDLKKIKLLVLYEASEIIVQQDLLVDYREIHKNLHSSCQMIFFSATYEKVAEDFIEHFVKNLITIQMRENLDNIDQYYVRCVGQEGKFNVLTGIYDKIKAEKSIIFCRSRKTAILLAEKMTKDGLDVAVLLGDCTLEQIRKDILERYEKGQEQVLIMTSVLVRGINFGKVAVVINFDLPLNAIGIIDCNMYLHRVSRIGKFGKKGTVINLVESEEALIHCKIIEQRFQCTIYELKSGKVGN